MYLDTFAAINRRRSVNVAGIIDLPSEYVIGLTIAVGKAVKPALSKGGHPALSEVAVQERFA